MAGRQHHRRVHRFRQCQHIFGATAVFDAAAGEDHWFNRLAQQIRRTLNRFRIRRRKAKAAILLRRLQVFKFSRCR